MYALLYFIPVWLGESWLLQEEAKKSRPHANSGLALVQVFQRIFYYYSFQLYLYVIGVGELPQYIDRLEMHAWLNWWFLDFIIFAKPCDNRFNIENDVCDPSSIVFHGRDQGCYIVDLELRFLALMCSRSR